MDANRVDTGRLSPNLGDAERQYCFAIAMKYVKDEEAANDVAQDALLLAHRHRDSFRGRSRYSTWLYRIAATTALMHLRSRRRRSREVFAPAGCDNPTEFLEAHAAAVASPEDDVANREAVEQAASRVRELGSKYGPVFWLRYGEGYTESEVAKRLSLNLSTVKTRAHRARVAVRDHLRAAG